MSSMAEIKRIKTVKEEIKTEIRRVKAEIQSSLKREKDIPKQLERMAKKKNQLIKKDY